MLPRDALLYPALRRRVSGGGRTVPARRFFRPGKQPRKILRYAVAPSPSGDARAEPHAKCRADDDVGYEMLEVDNTARAAEGGRREKHPPSAPVDL